MKATLILTAAAATTIAVAASQANADPGTVERFPGADRIVVKDFIGRIEIAGAGASSDITALIKDGDSDYPLTMREENGALVIAGEPRSKNFKLWKKLGRNGFGRNAFDEFLADYPAIQIVAPSGVDVSFDEVIGTAKGGDLGRLVVEEGTIEGNFGDLLSADIEIDGMGDMEVGRIQEDLTVKIGGSGNLEALSSGPAKLTIGGSGDIAIGQVNGPSDVSIGGSGDVQLADVKGPFVAKINGSGDITAGNIEGGAIVSISGSGDIIIGQIDGPSSVRISGGGDVDIDGGRAENFRISIAGSGDVNFGGTSTNLDVTIAGSGDVSVAKNEGSLKTQGDGTVRVGDKTYRRKR
ncbi:MAG: DUF2807 domain-containing protein [Pseudomonadota bacterium]